MLQAAEATDQATHVTVSLLQELFGQFGDLAFNIRLWDGTTWAPGGAPPPRVSLVLQHPGALRQMFSSPSELTLGEAYIYDDFDIEGDIEAVFELADRLLRHERSLAERMHLAALLRQLPDTEHPGSAHRAAQLHGAKHSKERDRQAVTYHYNVSNDFYALWLDSRMVYSSSYFADPAEDLETAQERKLDYICRKLRLRTGEHLLDLGCGWGGLVIHAVRNYGVHALGITLSEPQAEWANKRIHDAGLADRCRVEVLDYRDLDDPGRYHKLASVGMFEHVGEALLPEYFQRAWQLLKVGGVFLNTGVAITGAPPKHHRSFSGEYVFPDSELVPIATTLRAAEGAGFEVRDVESLREHYVLTLHHWLRNLEAKTAEAHRITDDITYRIWRLYIAGSVHRFQTGRESIFQVLLSKPDRGDSRLPLTRKDWYT